MNTKILFVLRLIIAIILLQTLRYKFLAHPARALWPDRNWCNGINCQYFDFTQKI